MTAKTLFVSRHAAARQWARREGIQGTFVNELDLTQVGAGDTVIGTLPAHLAAQVLRQGGRYFHLAIDVPRYQRGTELTPEEMTRFGARLVEIVLVEREATASEVSSFDGVITHWKTSLGVTMALGLLVILCACLSGKLSGSRHCQDHPIT